MEVFHGLTAMESLSSMEAYYPEFSSRKETKTVEDMWSMAFLSGISSDVEHFEDTFCEDRKPTLSVSKPAEQRVYSPNMINSPDSFGEEWLNDFLPLEGVYSPPMMPQQGYHPVQNTFPQVPEQQGGYSGPVCHDNRDSYPPSPLSNSTLDGSDISDLLEMVEDLTSEPSAMYSFSSSPPQAVPELSHPMESTIHSMLASPPAAPVLPHFTQNFYTYQCEESTQPKAKDIGSISDVEKLLMSPLQISTAQGSKKRSRSSKMASKPLEKRLKKKEQNKTAALRYRQKKREEKSSLTVRQDALEKENSQLREQMDSLEREIGYLKDLLNEVQRRRTQ